jgi:hypothetical protein
MRRRTVGKREFQVSALAGFPSPLRVPEVDLHFSGAGERVREAAAELERLGIANPDGTRIRTDLPEDMRSDADRDFGG